MLATKVGGLKNISIEIHSPKYINISRGGYCKFST